MAKGKQVHTVSGQQNGRPICLGKITFLFLKKQPKTGMTVLMCTCQ